MPSCSVLIIGNFLSRYGGSRGICEDLAEKLSSAGWHVLTASNKRARIARLADMLSTAWRRRRDYDVAQVDVYTGDAFVWAEAACWVMRRARKPYILTLHGGNLPSFSIRWPNRVRRLLRSATIVTAPSRYLQEQVANFRDDIVLLPNALDLSCYEYRSRANPAPKLVWLRAFHKIYNPLLAVDVLAKLKSTHSSASLLMIGPDKGDQSLAAVQARAQEHGLSQSMTIIPGVCKADVPKYLQRGDIFLNTTNADNTPVSVLEAQACGLCVVSTDVGGLTYLHQDGEDALLVPPDNAEAMAAAVRGVLTQPDLAGQLSRNARAKAEQYDWSQVLPRWQDLLWRVAASSVVKLI